MHAVKITLTNECWVDSESTEFTMDMTTDQAMFLLEVGRRAARAAETCCQPAMWIEVLSDGH